MKPEIFNSERAEIAAFAPYAIINEVENTLIMDVPTKSTDLQTSYCFRAVWDETADGEIEDVRIYALSPNFNEIREALLQSGVRDEQIERLFERDTLGNHLMETCGAKSGGLAVAYATAYLTLVSQLTERNEIDKLISSLPNWSKHLPLFGVNSCGYRISRNTANASGRGAQ